MRRFFLRAIVVTVLSATSCSNGSTSSTPNVAPANIATQAKLQFGVGTATIAYPGGSFVGTNFVSTFRGSDGHSATLVNTPTLSGPPSFALGFPGSLNSLSGILPNVFNSAVLGVSATNPTLPLSFGATLGPLVGVFGYGMAADNLISSQVVANYNANAAQGGTCGDLVTAGVYTATSASVPVSIGSHIVSVPITSEAQSHELGLPLGIGQGLNAIDAFCPLWPQRNSPLALSNFGSNPLPISYYGGPPAWPSAQGYQQPNYFLGYPLGFTDFAVPPVAGNYQLNVAYPTNQTSTTYGHFNATAALKSTNPLPPLTIGGAVINGDGTGSVSLTVPTGVTEAVVMVRVNCTNSNFYNYYDAVTHSTGQQVIVFSATLGPPDSSGNPTPTFCPSATAGTNGTAFAIGFDYPAYESSYPFNTTQTPTITNANGQADVTTSAPFNFTTGS